jgi:hypothetical protein
VIWDDEHSRLLIFSASGPKRDRLHTWATAALRASCIGDFSPLVRWTIDGAIKRARPEANPPAELPKRFWAWLIWHAHRGPRTLALPSTAARDIEPTTRYIRVEVDARLIMKPGDGTRRFEGVDAVIDELDETVSLLDEPADLYPLHSVDLALGTPEYRDDPAVRWEIRVRGDGTLASVNLCSSTDRAKGGDYDSRCLVLADAFFRAHDTWSLLVQAYDSGPLTDLLREQPQSHLWPLRTGVAGSWVAMEALPEDPDASEDGAQQSMGV